MKTAVSAAKPNPNQPSVCVLKVALQNRKRIWRRIAILSDQTLNHLHETIFIAFDRDDEHLYSFYFPLPPARGRDPLKGATEYAHPMLAEDDSFDLKRKNAATTAVAALRLSVGQRFKYLFDFGVSWMHEITVERLHENVDGGKSPRILDSRGDSPPQYPDSSEPDEDD